MNKPQLYRNCLFLVICMAFGLSLFYLSAETFAHPQPYTIVLLEIGERSVGVELQIPMSELGLALGRELPADKGSFDQISPELTSYISQHTKFFTAGGEPWLFDITGLQLEPAQQTPTGVYQEVKVLGIGKPPIGANTRNFILKYDGVVHEVVNHKALVSIRNNWDIGNIGATPAEAGVIGMNAATSLVDPLVIDLSDMGWWSGFKNLVALGIQHIREGTDHLLFLFVLLLPATLIYRDGHWAEFGGSGYSIKRLFKIVTAFTIGHSLTLLLGSVGIFKVPEQPVEILIAISILVSSIHAIRPIFPGKEIYVAGGFGLIHGAAFASVLIDLDLGVTEMALSILGFNIGIELMQLFVVILVLPWLLILSRSEGYRWFRYIGAGLTSLAALAWVFERTGGGSNVVTGFIEIASEYGGLILFIIAAAALVSLFVSMFRRDKHTAEVQR